jgi:hypothetical protein
MAYRSSPHHVTPLPPEVPTAMYHHEMWQNHEHHMRRGYKAREVPPSFRTPPPPPLCRMSVLSNFSDESVTNSPASFQWTSFEYALEAEEQDVNKSLTATSKAPSVEDEQPDAETDA